MGYETAFSPDYLTARHRFRAAATAAGARLESHPISGEGPSGEELAIDVALLGADSPSHLVIVSSGLHGVEGFLGSAIQSALLEGGLIAGLLPTGSALLLLHALEPHGFAWLRRNDAANVDLNRNFLPPGIPFTGSPPLYRDLEDWLNPKCAPRNPVWSLPRAVALIVRHGTPRLKEAIAVGQYDFPKGLFFGGHEPSPTRRLLAEHLPRWGGPAARIIHLDVHTGLGRSATVKLLLDSSQADRVPDLTRVFGPGLLELAEAGGTAYRVNGDFLPWCASEVFAGRRYDGLCAEFGTYPPLRVLLALRAENQAHHWTRPGGPETRQAGKNLREAFAPADPRWRHNTVSLGLDLIRLAVTTCAESGR